MNWNGQQGNFLSSSNNKFAKDVIVDEGDRNQYHHPYMDLTPMEHYHHGPEYLPHDYLHEHDHYGHEFPVHH